VPADISPSSEAPPSFSSVLNAFDLGFSVNSYYPPPEPYSDAINIIKKLFGKDIYC